MFEKMKETWESLNQNIVVNQRELVLGLMVCTLAGMVLGSILHPNVDVTIGSHNVLPQPEETVSGDDAE